MHPRSEKSCQKLKISQEQKNTMHEKGTYIKTVGYLKIILCVGDIRGELKHTLRRLICC